MSVADKNPFGDDAAPPGPPPDPFGEARPGLHPDDAARRIEQAARKIRGMRSRLGAEGLTPAATRDLIEEIATAFDAMARALRASTEE